MSIDDRADVKPKELAAAWGTNHQTVWSPIGIAVGANSFRDQLIEDHGYTEADFPEWWVPPTDPKGDPKDLQDQPKTPTGHVEPPENTANRNVVQEVNGGVGGVSTVGGSGLPAPKTGTEGIQTGAEGAYTAEQVSLLASKGVSYSPDTNTWVRVTPQGRGQYAEVVNPDTVLIKARDEKNQANYMDNIAEATLNNLSMTTQAILKKVALNPSVFQYVSNVRDPDTGAVLFHRDFDYISWAVMWATDKFYGVQPSYMVDRPSEYTRMRKNRAEMAQRQPLMDPLGGGFDPRALQGHPPGQAYQNSQMIPFHMLPIDYTKEDERQ
jgi:hypothetical protein